MDTRIRGSFKGQCEAVAEKFGLELTFFRDQNQPDDAFEDDGTLHVRKRNMRACFDVNRGRDDADTQNAMTRAVLRGLGMPGAIGERTLTDEEW